jgi:hypothetical protein
LSFGSHHNGCKPADKAAGLQIYKKLPASSCVCLGVFASSSFISGGFFEFFGVLFLVLQIFSDSPKVDYTWTVTYTQEPTYVALPITCIARIEGLVFMGIIGKHGGQPWSHVQTAIR